MTDIGSTAAQVLAAYERGCEDGRDDASTLVSQLRSLHVVTATNECASCQSPWPCATVTVLDAYTADSAPETSHLYAV